MTHLAVVLPALDEERHLERCVRTLIDDPWPRERLEILVVDGGSRDGTREVARRLAAELPFLRVIENPKRLQASAFNLALAAADPRAEILIRCDVHADYPPGFLSRAVAALDASGAALAGYGDAPEAETCFQRAVAFVQNTPLGVGGALYRLGGISRFVDHAKHGAFRRSAVEAVGGYDERFSHNEDSELSLRLWQAGHKVWLDAGLTVGYYPRATPKALARQYWLYGRGRAMTVMKHKLVPRPRQMAPVLLLLAEAAALAAAPFLPWTLLLFPLYAAALCGVGLWGAARHRHACLLAAPAVMAIMHHAWGAGFLARLAQGWPEPSKPRRTVAQAGART
jgi:succinoglycan biosynthesis protein ExoA